jgi:activator of HSP90 ATPase
MSEKEDLAVSGQLATRRQVIAGLAIALGGLAFRATAALAATEEELSRSQESIHHVTVFKASRKRVYEALTDTKQFDQVTKLSPEMRAGMSLGDKATEISDEVGGTFTLFGGHIVGRQVELVPGERIVQAWRVVDWDPGVYSIAKFELLEQGSGTKVVFDHTGFPKGQAEHLAAGWKAHYWETIEKFLG